MAFNPLGQHWKMVQNTSHSFLPIGKTAEILLPHYPSGLVWRVTPGRTWHLRPFQLLMHEGTVGSRWQFNHSLPSTRIGLALQSQAGVPEKVKRWREHGWVLIISILTDVSVRPKIKDYTTWVSSKRSIGKVFLFNHKKIILRIFQSICMNRMPFMTVYFNPI